MVYRLEVGNYFFVVLIFFVLYLDWTIIRRVFIRARQQFGLQPKNLDMSQLDMQFIEVRV